MGLFKSKEEREAAREQKRLEAEQFEQRIRNSSMTRQIQAFLLDKFGNLNSEEVNKLRQAGNGYKIEVQKKGILFTLTNRKGETLERSAFIFDALGYQDLSSDGVYILEKILFQTLSSISHLRVSNNVVIYIFYNENRAKQSW